MHRTASRSWWLIGALACLVLLAVVAQIPAGATDVGRLPGSMLKVMTMDLSAYSPTPPASPLDVLFIHHSVGGQWLADVGPDKGENCINESHPEGGGLRKALQAQGYVVHEASYGSAIGEHTDTFDMLPKFRTQMPAILQCAMQDTMLKPPERNRVVMFKSCFPNNAFTGEGAAPGNPDGPELTLMNAEASYSLLLPEFEKQPDVLFVCVTTPPLAPKEGPEPLWKAALRKALGKDREAKILSQGRLARQFANWLKADDGWLKAYPLKNVVVFDYFDVLTGMGESDLLKYPTGGGTDSHPSAEGQHLATEALIPFLNRAVHRAGLSS